MKLRVARHTTNLKAVTHFYTQILGLQILGDFSGHDGYDGIFLGLPDASWHLEFTVSAEAPNHHPDEDDLLVFYSESTEAYQQLVSNFEQHGIHPFIAKNPYWQVNGASYLDPDGYGVVIVNSTSPYSS